MTADNDHLDRLHAATAAARTRLEAAGADRWEIFAKASMSREVEVAPGRPLRVLHVEETGVAVRTFDTNRAGFAAASGLEEDASRRAINGALNTATPVAADPLPPERLLGLTESRPPRQLPATGWATHAGQELEKAVASLGSGHLRLRRAVLQEGDFAWVLVTGDGWVARHQDTSTSLMAEVEVVGERTGVWRDWLHIDNPDDFDLEAAASQITDRALLIQRRVATDSGLRDLLLHPEVAAQLVAAIAPLFLPVREEEDQLSNLLDSHGRLATPALTLVDDRCDPEAPITGPCDGEGFPSRRTVLLDEGVPRYRLASFRDGVRCSEPTRGGALRVSYRDYPATGTANLAVDCRAGVPAAELLGSADHALYLLRPLAAIEVDFATDTYRMIASGVWLDGPRVRGWHPVVELQGSLGRLLRRIEAVGNDRRWFQTHRGFIGAPTMLVRRQPVIG
ncbi:MAG: metallopeptidase TldD-related protein [Acidobacteriota bacterium]|nr:metallopeptidase TldD-related protein [Acidobacteriota bacterium]